MLNLPRLVWLLALSNVHLVLVWQIEIASALDRSGLVFSYPSKMSLLVQDEVQSGTLNLKSLCVGGISRTITMNEIFYLFTLKFQQSQRQVQLMENEVTIDENMFCFSMKNYAFQSFSLWMKIFWLFKNSKLHFENLVQYFTTWNFICSPLLW